MTETDFWKETWRAFVGIALTCAFLGSIYGLGTLLYSPQMANEKVLMLIEIGAYVACLISIPTLFLVYILSAAHRHRLREQSRKPKRGIPIAGVEVAVNRRVRKSTGTSWKYE